MQKRGRGCEEKEAPSVNGEDGGQSFRIQQIGECATQKVLVDSPEALRIEKERLRSMFATNFADEEQFELFCMLPIGPQQRQMLIDRTRQIELQKAEVGFEGVSFGRPQNIDKQ